MIMIVNERESVADQELEPSSHPSLRSLLGTAGINLIKLSHVWKIVHIANTKS